MDSQQYFNSNGLFAHKSYISNKFKGAIPKYQGVLHCRGYDFEEFQFENMDAPLSEPFFTRRMKLFSRPDGFMLYGKMRVDFFSTSDLLSSSIKFRLRLIRARAIFKMISHNLDLSLGIVHCSVFTRRFAL